MLICYTSDFHGRLTLYGQLTELLRSARPEVLVLGGDMHVEAEPDDPLGTQVAFVKKRLASMIGAWKQMVPNLHVIAIAGNHDLACTVAAMRELDRAGTLMLLEPQPPRQFGGLSWVGMPYTPPTPWWVKDFECLDRAGDPPMDGEGAVWDAATQRIRPVQIEEYYTNQPTMEQRLAEIPAIVGPWIFVCHAPPHNSGLDHLPDISEPVGSRAVRQFLVQRSPRLALHGHMHESPLVTGIYAQRIGDTLAINPGQAHEQLHAVLLDTADPRNTLRHSVLG